MVSVLLNCLFNEIEVFFRSDSDCRRHVYEKLQKNHIVRLPYSKTKRIVPNLRDHLLSQRGKTQSFEKFSPNHFSFYYTQKTKQIHKNYSKVVKYHLHMEIIISVLSYSSLNKHKTTYNAILKNFGSESCGFSAYSCFFFIILYSAWLRISVPY